MTPETLRVTPPLSAASLRKLADAANRAEAEAESAEHAALLRGRASAFREVAAMLEAEQAESLHYRALANGGAVPCGAPVRGKRGKPCTLTAGHLCDHAR